MHDRRSDTETYHELCAYTLTHPDPAFIHQYAVDAFAAQSADHDTKPITLAFALVGLYLCTERNYSGRQVRRVHTLLARRRKHWPSFDLPPHRGDISVHEVMAAPPGAARDEMIRRWCDSVWGAYSAGRGRVVELLETELA
jgi:hypothetical protein